MIEFVLGVALFGALLLSRDAVGPLVFGTRLLVISVLLALSFVSTVLPDARLPTVVAGIATIAALAATLPARRESPSARHRLGSLDRDRLRSEPTIWALLLTGWLFVRNSLAVGLSPGSLTPYLLSLLLLFVVLHMNDVGNLSPDQLLQPFLLFVVAVLVASPFLDSNPWQPCRASKCSVVGEIYRGIFPSENGMAIFVAFTLMLAVPVHSRGLRRVAFGVLGAVLLATGARTALLALMLATVGAHLLTTLTRRDGNDMLRISRRTAVAAALAFTSVGVIVLQIANRQTLSGRGRIWMLSLEQVPLSSPAGAGSSSWELWQKAGLLANHFPHSQYLHLQFSGGWIALGLFVAMFAALLRRAEGSTKSELSSHLAPILLILSSGTTEIIWNPATVDSFSVLIVTLLILGKPTRTVVTSPHLTSPHPTSSHPTSGPGPTRPHLPAIGAVTSA